MFYLPKQEKEFVMTTKTFGTVIETVKPLNLADTYDSSLDPNGDDEPTLKMAVPQEILNQTRPRELPLHILCIAIAAGCWFLPFYYVAIYLVFG